MLLLADIYYNTALTPLPFLSQLSYAFFDEIQFGKTIAGELFMRIKLRSWSEFNFSMPLRIERMVSLLGGLNKSVVIPNCVNNGYSFAEGDWVSDWLESRLLCLVPYNYKHSPYM